LDGLALAGKALKERVEGREHRRDAFREHQRRKMEAEQLREELAPLWNRIMNCRNKDAA
jgi:hypothetical protein